MIPIVPAISPLSPGRLHAARELLAPEDEAIAQLESEDQDRQGRRAIRENRHVGGRNHQCGGCSKFLRAINEDCSCGFHNDIRGRRNVGGYR